MTWSLRRPARVGALLSYSLALMFWVPACGASGAQAGQESAATRAGSISVVSLGRISRALEENSGVAVSRSRPGVLWSHNDSGGDPVLYAMDSTGTVLAKVRVTSAQAVDWEDIALGMCPDDRPGDCLYIGDFGDNDRLRTTTQIYVVGEPDPAEDDGEAVPASRLNLRYAEGPTDVESLAIDTVGDLFLVSKGRNAPVRWYRVARERLLSSLDAEEPLELEAGGELEISAGSARGRLVTAAAISPGGVRLAVRTYRDLFVFPISEGAVATEPSLHCELGRREPQGEGLDFLDEEWFVLTSESIEGRRGRVLRARCDLVAGGDDSGA